MRDEEPLSPSRLVGSAPLRDPAHAPLGTTLQVGATPLLGREEILAQRVAYLILRDLLAILEDLEASATSSGSGHTPSPPGTQTSAAP